MCAALVSTERRPSADWQAQSPPLFILSINPGSTSTKLALHRDREPAGEFEVEWRLPRGLRGAAMEAEIARYVAVIESFLARHEIRPDAVVGRGGFIPCGEQPLASGVYEVAAVRDRAAEADRTLYSGSVTAVKELDRKSTRLNSSHRT